MVGCFESFFAAYNRIGPLAEEREVGAEVGVETAALLADVKQLQ